MNRFVILIALMSCLSQAQANPWNSSNNPSALDQNYEYRFTALPLQADLDKKPWSETYWATSLGSINIRWNQAYPDGFHYSLNSREELLGMTKEQIATLSPSEKFDIYTGNYQYPLHYAVDGFASPHVPSWKGLCDGWSMAAVQFAEPKPIEVTNPDGIVIPFGSSDIKGLLAYYSQFRANMKQIYVGDQCHGGGIFRSDDACSDINPGAMHVILANELGLKKVAFMMDRDPGKQIWNQPVFGFKTIVLGSALSQYPDSVQVHTTIFYTDELEHSSWTPVGGTDKFMSDKLEMDYILDIDSNGKIVGGSFIGRSDHPDLFWKPQGQIKIENEFIKLNNLIQQQ